MFSSEDVLEGGENEGVCGEDGLDYVHECSALCSNTSIACNTTCPCVQLLTLVDELEDFCNCSRLTNLTGCPRELENLRKTWKSFYELRINFKDFQFSFYSKKRSLNQLWTSALKVQNYNITLKIFLDFVCIYFKNNV